MKYRTAATQIKEIPIVFRGTIEGTSTRTSDYSISGVNFNNVGADYIQGLNNSGGINPVEVVENAETITISINGEIYRDVPKKHDYSNIYYFGAPPSGGSRDYSEYPFAFVIWRSGNNTGNNLYCQADPSPADVELWAGSSLIIPQKVFYADLTGNGQIKRFHCRFALGENGTLHIKPYVILNGNIRIDLCAFASNGDNYISGDNEEIAFDCYVPVETHAIAYVEAENVGEYESILDAAMVVQYEDFIEPESIVGYEGINLNRR